ncbi:MAG: hypothetical protein Q8O95_03965 [bacterium]|nr:hypothetical protein [bacterium]
MSYVVGSKVKELIKKAGCNTAGDLIDVLSSVVEWHMDESCKRAKANGRKTVRGTDACMETSDNAYVVGSKVKEFNKKKGCNTAGDFVGGLNALVKWYAEQGCKRAKANGRKTVRGTDVMCK